MHLCTHINVHYHVVWSAWNGLSSSLFSPLVSVCLCDVPKPDQELVDKYESLKAVFLKRLAIAYANAHTTVEKLAEGTITGEKAKELTQQAKENERLQALSKLATWVYESMVLGHNTLAQGYTPNITHLSTALLCNVGYSWVPKMLFPNSDASFWCYCWYYFWTF